MFRKYIRKLWPHMFEHVIKKIYYFFYSEKKSFFHFITPFSWFTEPCTYLFSYHQTCLRILQGHEGINFLIILFMLHVIYNFNFFIFFYRKAWLIFFTVLTYKYLRWIIWKSTGVCMRIVLHCWVGWSIAIKLAKAVGKVSWAMSFGYNPITV